MTRQVAFNRYGSIIPKGELKVVEAKVERLDKLDGQCNATVIFEDEAGMRFKIRGYGGGPVAAQMKPLKWPEDVHGNYTFKCMGEIYQPYYSATAHSKQEALDAILAQNKWYKAEQFELFSVSAPKRKPESS